MRGVGFARVLIAAMAAQVGAAASAASGINFGNMRPMPGRQRTTSETKHGRQIMGAKLGNSPGHYRSHNGAQEIERRLRQIEKGMLHPIWGRDA